jgi:hypothetical protein
MSDIFKLILRAVIELCRLKASLEMEILTLRHQLNVLRRSSPKRSTFTNIDRLVFAALYRLVPHVVNSLVIIEPQTVIGWHRAGFRLLWRWKSRCRRGRPKMLLEIRQLIRNMSLANPLWGAPRIHGELLKLGIDVGQTSVAKYMARQRRPRVAKKLKLQERRVVIPSRRSLVACRPLGFLGRSRAPSRIGGHTRGTYGVGTYPGLHHWDGGP